MKRMQEDQDAFLVQAREAVTTELFEKTGVVRMFYKFTRKSRFQC